MVQTPKQFKIILPTEHTLDSIYTAYFHKSLQCWNVLISSYFASPDGFSDASSRLKHPFFQSASVQPE